MRFIQDEQFRSEADRYRLKFCCEDCGLFNPEDSSCVYGYPTADHRKLRYLDTSAAIVFCKDFELSEA